MSAVVHQALHGYSDGHRLISSSLPLSGSDARTMQVLSDLSGPGVRPPPNGYLTGYPLEGVGGYVLARTWAALEMPRPGCVWTHSLIIENADLARMSSAAGLLSQFRRPEPASLRSYDMPVTLDEAMDQPRPAYDNPHTSAVLNALYAAPEKVVVAEALDQTDEAMVLGIWMQQWPRLRRAFSFCTFAGIDRSQRTGPIDLQLTAGGLRLNRAKFPGAVSPSDVSLDARLQPLLFDLNNPLSSELREFLRRAGGDVAGGRKAMAPLCSLYSAIFARGTPDLVSAVHALEGLDTSGRPQARTVRSLVARQALAQIDELDPVVFDFLVDALADERAGGAGEHAVKLGTTLWRRTPERFIELLDEEGPLADAAASAIDTLTIKGIISGLEKNPTLVGRLVSRRPDLLESPNFWSTADTVEAPWPQLLPELDAAKVASAMIVAGHGAVPAIIHQADPRGLADALNLAAWNTSAAGNWLQRLADDPAKTGEVLATGALKHTWMVAALARRSSPDHYWTTGGEDQWWTAISSASGKLPPPERDEFAAFLMARALNRFSASSAQLFRYSFTDTYRALERGHLYFEVQRLLDWRLDWGGWFEWEAHVRLKKTVVQRFISWNLDPETFGRLADDGKLAFALFDEAARSERGRRYLAEVRKSLKGASDKGMKGRWHYIEGKIK